MQSPSMPNAKAICDAVGDATAFQSLLLKTLSHGTDYDVLRKSNGEDISQRTAAAAKVLVEVWSASPALEPILVDSLWLAASQCDQDNGALAEIIKALVQQVPDREEFWKALQSTLDPALLEKTGLLQPGGSTLLKKKMGKLNTDSHYRQQKFNLFSEVSEGYAKLLSALTTSDPLPTFGGIRDLIGTFELDPNRVLDLLLDVLESHMPKTHEAPTKSEKIQRLLELIQHFSVDKIPHLLGFKIASSSCISQSMYALIAFLAIEGVLDLKDLTPHLSSVTDIDDAHALYEECERQRIQDMGRIRLSADDGSKKEDPKLDAKSAKLNEATSLLEKNSLIGLIRALLFYKEWDLVQLLLGGALVKLCTLLPVSIGNVVCDLISEQIKNVYRANVLAPLREDTSESPSSDGGVPEDASLEQALLAILDPLEGIVGSACISSQPVLYCQLCRLMKALLEKEVSAGSLSCAAYAMLKMLVSSLSLFSPNPAISADLWSLLSILPYPTRYSLYKDWRGGGLEKAGLLSKPPANVRCEMEAGKSARYSLKRLSKDNIRDMGCQVSKVTHSNPLVVFSTILSQVESYDNLIDMMVEAVRFVTPLGLDALGYCILSRLDGTSDGGSRTKMKGDGVNVSQWLSSLEAFTGAFYKKCPQVEFRGIIWYLIGRLKEGHVQELGILRTLLKTAGGYAFADYSPVASLSATQLEGRAGSQLLKRETFAFGVVEQSNHRASRIVQSVLQEDNMGVMILILLAQIRTKVIFDTAGKPPKPVKLIGNLYDSCQVVANMLLEFLTDDTNKKLENGKSARTNIAMRRFAESLPSLGDLNCKYGLDAESSWMLCRPVSRAAVVEEAVENGERTDESMGENAVRSFLPTGGAMIEIYRGMLPEHAWEDLTVVLFGLFYSHALYDISCPETSYETEVARLTKEAERLTQRQKGTSGSLMPSLPFSKADEAELERVKRTSAILASDRSLHQKCVEKTLDDFDQRKAECFRSETVSIKSVQAFIMYCIYQRCMSSPDDAMYCARFVELLHQNETPGFSTLFYVDELVDVVAGALYGVTESEAANLAIMLLETWKMVSRWRYDEDAFVHEVDGKLGSCFMFGGENVLVSVDQYESLYNKWHAKLGTVLLGSLNSSEYMVARACLLVLMRIVDVFPTRPGLGQRLLHALEPLQDDSYPLQDIKTAAQAYGMLLVKARENGVWKEEDAAVAEARELKEKEALAVRQKKAEEQFEMMKAESEKITAEIGESGWRGRDDRRRGPARGSFEQRTLDTRRTPLGPGAINFEPAKGAPVHPLATRDISLPENGGASRLRRGEDDGRGRDRSDDRTGEPTHRSTRESSRLQHGRDRVEGDRSRMPPSADSGRRDESARAAQGRESSSRQGGRESEPAGLDGRWERGGTTQDLRTRKRGRSSDVEERTSKRGRSDGDGEGARPTQERPPPSDGAAHSRHAPASREPQRTSGPTRHSERRR